MAAIEKTTNIDVNGKGAFSTVQRFTSRHLARPTDLFEGQNVDLFENPGKAKLGSKGYTAQGSTLGGTIRGLYGHVLNDGTEVSFAIKGNNSYVWNGSAWSNSGSTTLTGTDRSSFTSFLNRALMTDGTQTLSSADGITWDATLFTSAPTNCVYIERFDTRIILANKSTIYWSSQPNDALTDVTWNTTEFNLVPETDDGDYMTGIKRLRKRLLVFKNFSTQRMFINGDLDTDLLTIDETIGCTNKDAVITYGGLAYFFGTARDGECGIFTTDGDSVKLISRAVQDIIRAIPQTSYSNIRAGLKNGVIKFYVGDVTVDGKTISKCEIQFSPRDDGWQYRSLAHEATDYAPMKIDSNNDLFFAENTGLIMKDESGTTFNGTEINSILTTHFIYTEEINKTSTAREIYITGKNLQSAIVRIAPINDEEKWKSLNNKLTTRDDLFKGLFLEESGALRIQITSNKTGVEVYKILITKKSNTQSDIYG